MSSVLWKKAPDVKKIVSELIISLELVTLKSKNIHCYRSYGSISRAYARIWGLSKIWQLALNEKPSYVIEVLSEKYDRLPQNKKTEVLIHELTHIPLNFSGALMPHVRRGKRSFHKKVDNLISRYFSNTTK